MDVDEMVGQATADDNEESELSELEEDGQQGEGEKTDEDEGEVELTESMMPLSKLPTTVLSAGSGGDEDGREGKKRKTTDGKADGKATKGGKGKKKLTTNADTNKPLPMPRNKRKASSFKAKTPAPAPPVASSPRSKPKAQRLDVSASGSQYDAFETYNPDDTQCESLAPPPEPSPKKKTPYTNNKGRGKGKERALPTPTGTGLRRGGRTSEARDYSEITDDEETPIEDILPPLLPPTIGDRFVQLYPFLYDLLIQSRPHSQERSRQDRLQPAADRSSPRPLFSRRPFLPRHRRLLFPLLLPEHQRNLVLVPA
jgi:hypothetical protein